MTGASAPGTDQGLAPRIPAEPPVAVPPGAPDLPDLPPEPPEPPAAVQAATALLEHPALAQNLGIAVLSKMALDDKLPPRERRRAAEVLAGLKLKAVEVLGAMTGAKEQTLKALGIESAPTAVNVTQNHTKIEIVRRGTSDWRSGEGG